MILQQYHRCMGLYKMDSTFTVTLPRSFSISPSIAEMRDDFPAPTEPTTATREPRFKCKLILQQQHVNVVMLITYAPDIYLSWVCNRLKRSTKCLQHTQFWAHFHAEANPKLCSCKSSFSVQSQVEQWHLHSLSSPWVDTLRAVTDVHL